MWRISWLAFVLISLSGIAENCSAAEVEKLYYIGEATLSSDSGQSRGSQVILLEKIHDSGQSVITERAIVVQAAGQPAEEHTMTMKVTGDQFTITDARKTITGTGRLFGPAWRWTYFKATYESTTGIRIEDENFMNDPAVLVGRKRISGRDGKTLIYMDVALKATTPETFKILTANLLQKNIAPEK